MADTAISALTAAAAAASTNQLAINEAGTTKRLSVDLLREYIIKRTAGTTTAAGEFITWLVLAADPVDITGVTQTTVMTITGVGVGRYYFRCLLVYQAAVISTGIDVSVNHTGTTTQWVNEIHYASTGQLAATAAASETANNAAGNIYEQAGGRTKNTIIGAGTVSVDAINSDMWMEIEGFFVVSVTGSLEIKMAAEAAALVVRAKQGSFLELKKLS